MMSKTKTGLYHSDKANKVRADMKKCHPGKCSTCSFNLSFRYGDALHSQWTFEEETLLLPYLVSSGLKPVATIASENIEKLFEIEAFLEATYPGLNVRIKKNRWNMYVLTMFKKHISEQRLYNLNNEFLTFKEMGLLYGYSCLSTKCN